MSAIEIIKTSAEQHETLFLDALRERAYEDAKYAATRESTTVKRSVLASFEATHRALDYIDRADYAAFVGDMSAGIIALNVACSLQCLSPHVRTQSAVAAWG